MIKLFATDMDGTLLREDKSYDKDYFLKLFAEIEKRGLYFATASGNLFRRLEEYFPEVKDKICYVANNGSTIYIGEEEVYRSEIDRNKVDQVTEMMMKSPLLKDKKILVTTEEDSYLLKGCDPYFVEKMKDFLPSMIFVNDFSEVDRSLPLIKVSMFVDHDKTMEVEEKISQVDGLVATTSGFHAIDVMNDHISKASGLAILQKELGIEDNEVATFGDNRNDLPMIIAKKYSFAMSNAAPIVKQAAFKTIGSNEEQAVLTQIEHIMHVDKNDIRDEKGELVY